MYWRWFRFILYGSLIDVLLSITCYECTSSQGSDCRQSATSCQYGVFGCHKIAIYSGGVDRMGNFYDEEHHIISMIRGCALLPLSGADMCSQTSIFGARVVTCTCFNDYCNSTSGRNMFTVLLPAFVVWIFFV